MFIQLNRDEKITAFIEDILDEESDAFKKRFISMLARLDEFDWKMLEKMSK